MAGRPPSNEELRDKPITVMCSPSLRERAEKIADTEGRTLSWVGHKALEEYCDRQEKKRK